MPAITYRLDADKLWNIRQNAAASSVSVPKYLDYFMDFAAAPHGKKQYAAAQKKPAKRGKTIRKGTAI